MTARGTNVKAQSLSNEKELYLFDRRLLDASSSPPIEPIPRLQAPSPFPDNLESETQLSSWRTLFKKRLSWSESVLSHAQNLATIISDTDASTNVIQRSVQIAFSNLESHSAGLQNSLVKLREWAEGVLVQRDQVFQEWEPAVKRLVRVAVHDEIKKFAPDENKDRKISTLVDFFDVKRVQTAAATAKTLAQHFEKEVVDLGGTIEEICSRTTELKSDIQKSKSTRSLNVLDKMKVLLGEIDVLVKKIRTDFDYVRELQGPKSVSVASKRAYASTADYLPGLVNIISDMGRLLQMAVKQKNDVSTTCVRQLQIIAFVQSLSAPVNPHIQKLDATYQEEDESSRLLSLVIHFPKIYGSLLVECVRRREWSEKFANISKKVAEELALLKEDEEKRRKKWQRNTGTYLPFELEDNSQIMRAELNTRGDSGGGLPKITRPDVEAFLATIQTVEGLDSVSKEVRQLFQDLDRPLKRQTKRLKGFKYGSIHEAQLGVSSIFGRNDEEEVKMLREDKQNLTERVKGYESRIRKLEDLLHRGRTTSGNVYHVPGSSTPQQPSTPQPGQTFPASITGPLLSSDQPGSPATRRISAENVDKSLVARVSGLEAELTSEKELTARLQRDASARSDLEKAMNARISQADDTKRDLVANLEALDQQHVAERKELKGEIEELRQKLDETYEEVDRMEEGKNEELEKRTAVEEQVKGLKGELAAMAGEVGRLKELSEKEAGNSKALQAELDLARSSSNEESESLRQEVESLRRSLDEESQRAHEAEAALADSDKANRRLVENIGSMEAQTKQMKDALDNTILQNASQLESRESLVTAMKQAHSQLSSDSPPEDLNALMDSIEALIGMSIARSRELSAKLEEEKSRASELESSRALLQSRFESRTIKAKDLTQRLYTHNARSIQLLESLGYRIIRGEESMQIVKVSRSSGAESTVLSRSTTLDASGVVRPPPLSLAQSLAQSSTVEDINLLYWMETEDSDAETEKYTQYLRTIGAFDLDAFSDTVVSRVKKLEQDCRQLVKQCRAYREKYYRSRDEANEKIAYKSFKPGDLALFLPTKNSFTRPWAAFNVNAPHFFLKEDSSHKLSRRDWLLARISKIEDRIVDLSRSTAALGLPPSAADKASIGGNSSDGASVDDENPFELSDGLRWYLLDAVEEKPGGGAPSTPGLSSSTVAAANVDARGSLKSRKPTIGARKKLTQITSDNSRRSSSGSNSHRNSISVPPEAAAILQEAINGNASALAVTDSLPSTPLAGAGEKAMEVLRGLAGDGSQQRTQG